MENYEELLNLLEDFERTKPKELPKELEDFIGIVAKIGDPIYPWPKIKPVYRSKIMNVLTQFFEAGPTTDITQFSFDNLKSKILERFDLFRSAPFTIQRISELLINPRKEYNRIDKFIRAIEKNILVVSVVEPGCSKHVHLNGSMDIDEGFQVSSTSIYEEYRQRVAGIMENEAAAASISEDEESKKLEGGCKKGEEDFREEYHREHHKEKCSQSSIDNDEESSSQGRILANQGSMLDHQEFHRLEFSLAETDTLAIVEIVSEVDCPPDGCESNEEASKDYSLGNSNTNDDSTEGIEPSDGAMLSVNENHETITEDVHDVDGITDDNDMVNEDKGIKIGKPAKEIICTDTLSHEEDSLIVDDYKDGQVDSQLIDVIDISSSINVDSNKECDCVPLTKVLVLSSSTGSQSQESENYSKLLKLKDSEKIKEEIRCTESGKNDSASEKLCVEEDGNEINDVESDGMKNLEESIGDSEVSPGYTLSVEEPIHEDTSSSMCQESKSSPKNDSS